MLCRNEGVSVQQKASTTFSSENVLASCKYSLRVLPSGKELVDVLIILEPPPHVRLPRVATIRDVVCIPVDALRHQANRVVHDTPFLAANLGEVDDAEGPLGALHPPHARHTLRRRKDVRCKIEMARTFIQAEWSSDLRFGPTGRTNRNKEK